MKSKRTGAYVKFEIKGLNVEKSFNKFYKEINLYDLERTEKSRLSFKVRYKDAKKTKKFLSENNFEILSAKKCGFLGSAMQIFFRYGIIASLIIAIILQFILNMFIFRCVVYGNETIASEEIINACQVGLMKKDVDTNDIELSIMNKFDRISFCSVIIKGQTLIINVKEKLAPEEHEDSFKPVISKYNAKITNIKLISGTCVVKVGDIVKQGDILIEPYIIDSSGQRKEVKAEAEIIADVYFEGNSEHYEVMPQVVRTGVVQEERIVQLFGLNIYGKDAMCKFDSYEKIEEINYMTKLFLPFKIKKITYYQTKNVIIEIPFSEIREEKIKEAKEKAMQYLEDCDIIKEEYNTITENFGHNKINYVIVVHKRIDTKEAL